MKRVFLASIFCIACVIALTGCGGGTGIVQTLAQKVQCTQIDSSSIPDIGVKFYLSDCGSYWLVQSSSIVDSSPDNNYNQQVQKNNPSNVRYKAADGKTYTISVVPNSTGHTIQVNY